MIAYLVYSSWVYTHGTDTVPDMTAQQQEGKLIFEKNNCNSCHQLFGLGGFLGPELTTVISDRQRGPLYARALLRAGGSRMPDFHFSDKEVDALISFFQYVDSTATTYKTECGVEL